MRKLALAAVFALAALSPATAFGHSLGYSLEYVAPEGFFDIGYSDPLVAMTPIRFDLGLYTEKNGEQIPFTGTWVRISQGPRTVFAGPIGKALFGSPGFTYAFPVDGDYELSIRFEDEGGSIAQHAFALTVAKGGEEGGMGIVVAIASAALAVGAAAGFLVARSAKRRR